MKVETGNKNKRRVLILKDSFGNALPGYLFYSFEEIHVVDYRYFTKNMKEYVRANKITDILFANNIFNAYSNKIWRKYVRFLNQAGGVHAPADSKANKQGNDTKHNATTPARTEGNATNEPVKESVAEDVSATEQ